METVTSSIVSRKPHWSTVELFWVAEYDTYLKLKELHKWYYKNKSLESAYDRWWYKLPSNRVQKIYKRNAEGQRIGVQSVTPLAEPAYFKCDLSIVVLSYKLARQPFRTEEEARRAQAGLLHLTEINKLYEEAKAFFG